MNTGMKTEMNPITMNPPGTKHQQGFTLLELMVSISIFAVLSAMCYTGLNSTLFNTRITQSAIQELRTLQLAVLVIERDITQTINRNIRDEFGDFQGYVMSGNGFDSILQLTRSGWRNPADQVRSNLQRVNYVLGEGVLYREFWTMLDRPDEATRIRTELLENVEKFEIRFLDQSKQWNEQWPPLGSAGGPNLRTPIAIEVVLELETFGEIKRLLKLPL